MNMARLSTLTIFIQHGTGNPSQYVREEKEIIGILIVKVEVNHLLTSDKTIYV